MTDAKAKLWADFYHNQGDATIRMATRKPFIITSLCIGMGALALSATCGVSAVFGIMALATPIVYCSLGALSKLTAFTIRKLALR